LSSKQYFRTADRNQYLDTRDSGFVVRKHTPVAVLSNAFMILSIVILAVVGVLFYDMLTGFYICLISGMMMFFISNQLERINRIQLSTDFMNAAFSSVIGRDYRFCFVTRNDGEIIYLNRPFQDTFPGFLSQPILNVATLCSMQGGSKEQSEKLVELMNSGKYHSHSITLKAGEASTEQTFLLSIEPIDTPKGYTMVRGK